MSKNTDKWPIGHPVVAKRPLGSALYGAAEGAEGEVVDHFEGDVVQVRFGDHYFSFSRPADFLRLVHEAAFAQTQAERARNEAYLGNLLNYYAHAPELRLSLEALVRDDRTYRQSLAAKEEAARLRPEPYIVLTAEEMAAGNQMRSARTQLLLTAGRLAAQLEAAGISWPPEISP